MRSAISFSFMIMLGAFFLGGCATDLARTNVARAIPCPKDLTQVTEYERSDGKIVWEGTGCGRSVHFTCEAPTFRRQLVCVQDGQWNDAS